MTLNEYLNISNILLATHVLQMIQISIFDEDVHDLQYMTQSKKLVISNRLFQTSEITAKMKLFLKI